MLEPGNLKVVFMGTPDFALPPLEGLLESGVRLAAVYTQPDRPRGRGQKLTPSPVKELALKHGIPVLQPARLRNPEAVAELKELAPDLVVVVAYGQILPQAVLDIPSHGCINIHASLLPKFRGAAPIHRAVMAGEEVTGITTMQMDAGLDTGPMLVSRSTPIGFEETAGELHDRLALLGRETLEETLSRLCAGTLEPEPQDDAKSSYAPMLKKEEGRIDWSRDALELHNLVRGLDPWPGAFTFLEGEVLKPGRTLPETGSGEPGTVVEAAPGGVVVACGSGLLRMRTLQLAGRKRMSAEDFLRGRRLAVGTRLEP